MRADGVGPDSVHQEREHKSRGHGVRVARPELTGVDPFLDEFCKMGQATLWHFCAEIFRDLRKAPGFGDDQFENGAVIGM